MKKYRQAFPKSAFIIYGVLNVVSLAAIVFSSLKLAGAGELVSYFPVLDVTTIAVFVAFMVLTALLLFRAYYAFTEKTLVLCRGLFRTVLDRDLFAKFVYDEATAVGALYYADPHSSDVARYVVLHLRKRDLEPFVEDLRRLKSDVVVEVNPVPPKAEV